jgi:hypothetical protein
MRAAVALSPSLLHVAISPAPAMTASGGCDADGRGDDDDDAASDAAGVEEAWALAAMEGRALDTEGDDVEPAAPATASDRRTTLRRPNSRMSVATKATTPSTTERVREPGSGVEVVTSSAYRDLAKGILEARRGRDLEQPLEAVCGVRDEVEAR